MSVRVIDNTTRLISRFGNQSDLAVELAGRDMVTIARPNTPADKGTLRQRAHFKRKGGAKVEVIWPMEYAAYQERGSRADGSRPVRNYTSPGTGPGFAENAAKQVNDNSREYFRKAGLL